MKPSIPGVTLPMRSDIGRLRRTVVPSVPPGTSSGRTFRLKGKGFPAKEGHGDLLATVQIALPAQPDPEIEALMTKWRTDKPYDPRKDM